MMHLSWAVFCEGNTDRAYYNVLLPRVMQEILLAEGTKEVTVPAEPAIPLGTSGRSVDKVAQEICTGSEAFYLAFIHADVGGRALAQQIDNRSTAYCKAAYELCKWPTDRCVIVAPRHETEAWALSDRNAVAAAFGFSGQLDTLDLPIDGRAAEAIRDPKAKLNSAYRAIVGRRSNRSASQALPAIARRQDISRLKSCETYRIFEDNLRKSLISLGCLRNQLN